MSNYPIRWMIRRDMPAVLDIERASFAFPWPEAEFIRCLRQKNCIGMVVTPSAGFDVLGFMVYELNAGHLDICNFAVHPKYRRGGVGRAMIGKLRGKLSAQRRRRITTLVRETNVDAQLFFRAMGFRAGSVLRGYYDESDEDAYCFAFALPCDVAAAIGGES